MPFLVTTKRPCPACVHGPAGGGEHRPGSVSRRAVATLEDVARQHPALCIAESADRPGEDLVCLFDEVGGSLPLPDGTVIEVEPLPWFKVAMACGRLRDWQIAADTTHVGPVKAEIIAAYNTKQAT